MIKLYKTINSVLHYWETWENGDGSATIHWGIAGEKGESKVVKSSLLSSTQKKVQDEINKLEGYAEIPAENHHALLIEYAVDGFGAEGDLRKRHALEDKMQGVLGWTGLGHCDGGSIGSGTMEVCCFVVNFELAKKVIEASLTETEFRNYTRIYDEAAL